MISFGFLDNRGACYIKPHLQSIILILSSLSVDTILDFSKWKVFIGDKMDVARMLSIIFGMLEKIVKIGENAGFELFLFFPLYFQRLFSLGLLKVRIVWEWVKDRP